MISTEFIDFARIKFDFTGSEFLVRVSILDTY